MLHVDPCDCNLDEEEAGERCMANSRSYWALMLDEGAHGWSMAFPLDRDLVEALRGWFDADGGSVADRQAARVRLHEAWYAARRVAPCRYCGDTGIIGAESNPGRSHCSECETGRALIAAVRRRTHSDGPTDEANPAAIGSQQATVGAVLCPVCQRHIPHHCTAHNDTPSDDPEGRPIGRRSADA
jgi:hypothetical protein